MRVFIISCLVVFLGISGYTNVQLTKEAMYLANENTRLEMLAVEYSEQSAVCQLELAKAETPWYKNAWDGTSEWTSEKWSGVTAWWNEGETSVEASAEEPSVDETPAESLKEGFSADSALEQGELIIGEVTAATSDMKAKAQDMWKNWRN
jgi:hypothetical protein